MPTYRRGPDKATDSLIYTARNYSHDTYETSETVEHLTDPVRGAQYQAWPEDIAEQYASEHNPGYEIGYEFEFDPEANTVVVTKVWINGQELTP